MAPKRILRAASVIVQLVLPHTGWQWQHADAFSAPVPTASAAAGVETTARRRMGKKAFLQKQSRNKLPSILSPEELRDLGLSLSKRRRGSHSFHKGWIHWRTSALDAIRYHLSQNLPRPADKSEFENLFFRLGVASDVGEMPSFEEAGARSGYAVEFFCRARYLADLYVDALNPAYEFPQFWLDGLMGTPMLDGDVAGTVAGEGDEFSMVSLGGGPGFDYVSAAVASSFCSYTSTKLQGKGAMRATILDYEEGWGDLVRAMGNSTQQILQTTDFHCDWGGKCDITKSIFDPCNAACLLLVNETNLWTCQYCVAENAMQLKESKFVFFHELFRCAQPGSLFVLSEVHPRIWPDFYRLMEDHCPYMQIGFNKNGRQMLLRKSLDDEHQNGPLISEKDRLILQKFVELGDCHERKISSGWQRQEPKIRGGKETGFTK
ncbi:hypothetical protein ACHAWF_004169 [Thalassiosira exigua]